MSDEWVTALLPGSDLRVVLATTGALSREARRLGSLAPASAELLAQGLTAVALMAALQKSSARIHLQLECDGAVRGMFVDGDAEGHLRGYVKNRHVEHAGAEGPFRWRPVLGNSGFLSVLRDFGAGEHYRSAVELRHFDLPQDLEHYFAASEQLPTRILWASAPVGGDALGAVAGLFLQPLPSGDLDAWAEHGRRLGTGMLQNALAHESGTGILKALFPEDAFEITARVPLVLTCSCSRERVTRTLLALGRTELEDLLAKDGKAEVTCEFCRKQYVIEGEEIRALLSQT